MFVDRIRVFAQAGDGGRGCVSFRREKFVPRGGPDGGDGGRGGDIVLRADTHTDNLANMFYEPIIKAKSGGHGQGKQMHGRGAEARIVKVPVGTIVYPAVAPVAASSPAVASDGETGAAGSEAQGDESGEGSFEVGPRDPSTSLRMTVQCNRESIAEPIVDLTTEGQDVVLCHGGKGGKGNVHFKSSKNRAPVQYTDGEEGERGYFLLELRTIADAGLIGYPNAGKSTLLGKISAAHPKVAAYPFTTLHPSVGIVDLDGYRRVRVADIPGLIEGAHRNVGLGHDFLRHITRCSLFLFVLDVAGSEGRHPVEDLQNLRREIDLYDPRLSVRPWCVIANKMDLPGADENLVALQQRFPSVPFAAVSAAKGEGLGEVKALLARLIAPAAAESLRENHQTTTEPITVPD